MKCPVCIEPELTMTERQGIEIDYCPVCRGIWLDRGELDKIVERTATIDRQAADRSVDDPQGGPRRDGYPRFSRDQFGRDKYRDDDHSRSKRYRKKNLLAELFDFD